MPAQDPEQWLTIDDFSPGCFAYTNTSSLLPFPDRLIQAPKGAADPAGTFSCAALPQGGLSALPNMSHTYTYTGSPIEAVNYLTGLLAHDELNDGTTELFICVENDDGTNHFFRASSFIAETAILTAINGTTEASGSGYYGSPYPQLTRAANTNPTTTPGNPVIVYPVGSHASPTDLASGQLFMYPDPAAPNAYGAKSLITGGGPPFSSITGRVLVHQSRIICLTGVLYGYPAGGGFQTVENINFTDPPNSTVYGFQQTVLAAEEPFGYGCGGSISAGELFLVKQRGGGMLVTGDIFSPTVTFLPGVQPTGGVYGNAGASTIGLAYCSISAGCWVWNGSNTSEKISSQLDNNFFIPPEFYVMGSPNYGFYCQGIGEKIYVSNNWMYDTRTKGWWKYYPDTAQGGVNLYWANPTTGRYIYAAPLSFTSGSPIFAYQFDTTTPAQHYQWTSLPLKLLEHNRRSDVRQVMVTASCTTPTASVTLTILDDGAVVWGPTTMTGNIPTGGLQQIRFNTGAVAVTKPQIRINVDNGSAEADAAVIHEIDIMWKPRAHEAASD